MRIELSIYTDKKQKARLRKIEEQLILILFTPLQSLLPVIEAVAAGAVLFLFCCMDSENLQVVLHWAMTAGSILGASFLLHCYIRGELHKIRTERMRRSIRYSSL